MHQSVGRGAEAISMVRGGGVFRTADPPLWKQPPEEDLLLGILSGIPSSILIFDRSLRVVFANRNLLVKLRKGRDDVLGKKVRDIFPPVILSYTNMEENLSIALTGKPLDGEEMEYRAPGLATRAYFYSLTPLRDQAGFVRNVMLFMDDVTEKKALGARMVRAERHLASVVESANDLIVSVNAAGAVMTWNSAAERVLGFSAVEMVGKPFGLLLSEAERVSMEALFAQLLRSEEPREREVCMRSRGGQSPLISWRYSVMKEEGGQVVALVGMGRDLTRERQLHLQVIQSAKMAALGEMAGGIAHEIRNPLAISSAASQLLLKKGDDPAFRNEAAQKIIAAVARATIIIENLLRFARPSGGLAERLDINGAIEDSLSLVGHQLAVQPIAIVKRLAAQLPVVKGDRNQLQQVFLNILLNACHAMPEGGSLTIETQVMPMPPGGMGRSPAGESPAAFGSPPPQPPSADAAAPMVQVRITDTGYGIPNENLARVFDPFFTTMPTGQGTGLGLSIAYGIVRQHGGAIAVQSQVGMGATFTISLPALAER
ncbi:MAG: PAS domain-containing protein [candidate division NC10 bacterium]